MQGQRSAIGSLPEPLGFNHGSTSSDAGIDQQICWNNVPTHNMLPDHVTPPGDPSGAYLNSRGQGEQNLSTWHVGEPSSSRTQNHASHDERKAEIGWSTPRVAYGGAGPVVGEQQYEPANILSLNNVGVNHSRDRIANVPLFVRSSSDVIPQDLNMTAGIIGHGSDDCHITDCPNAYKPVVPESSHTPSASSSSDPFGAPSGGGAYSVEENDGRPGCSLDGRRLSCKRKALEGNTVQSSISGGSSYFQQAESSVWHSVPGRYNTGSTLSISTPSENVVGVGSSEQLSSRVGLGAEGTASEIPFALNVAGNAERSQRNRVRINPSRRQDYLPNNIFSRESTTGHSNASSEQHTLRLRPLNNSLDMRSPDNTSSQRQSIAVHVPALQRTPHSFRWNGGSSSRTGHISSSGNSDAVPQAESNSISIPRNISEHPMFVPANEMRNSAQSSTHWSLTGGNISIAGNVASTSRTGSSLGAHQLSSPNWVPHRNPPQYPRRLSELVRRSLLSSAGSEPGGLSSSSSPIHSGSSSQEMALSSGAGNQGHHLPHSRSAVFLERQLDGAFGIPHSLRTLAAASEGRSRLVSEIRNVLDLMRRGEGLRFEDVMILDQSVFFGIADIHDRHRDMRLDVDNMSYEELLALEERIGNVSTGLSEETILSRLKQRKFFSIAMSAQLDAEPCCVCQEEYSDGEDVGTLDCGHEFHSHCIKQWLMHKNLCPICKTTALSK